MPRAVFTFVAALSLAALAASTASAYDPIDWAPSLAEAQRRAKEQNRLVLIHFWSESCPPCVRLERSVFNRREFVNALHGNYIPVKVNTKERAELTQRFRIHSIPTDVILAPDGHEVHRSISPADPDRYIAMLDEVAAHQRLAMQPPPSTNLPLSETTTISNEFNIATPPNHTPAGAQHSQPQQRAIDNPFARQTFPERAPSHSIYSQQAGHVQSPEERHPAATRPQQPLPPSFEPQHSPPRHQGMTNPSAPRAAGHEAMQRRQLPGQPQQQQQQQQPRGPEPRSQGPTGPEFRDAEAHGQPPRGSETDFTGRARSIYSDPLEEQPATHESAPVVADPNASAPHRRQDASRDVPRTAAQQTGRPAFEPSLRDGGSQLPTQRQPEALLGLEQPFARGAAPGAPADRSASTRNEQGPWSNPQGSPVIPQTQHTARNPGPAQARGGSPAVRQLGQPAPIVTPPAPPIGLDGYCPVSLVEGDQWSLGDPRWQATFEQRTYYFTGPQQRERFLREPARYCPAMSGYDIVHYREHGVLVPGKRAHGVFAKNERGETRGYYLFADESSLEKFCRASQAAVPPARTAQR